MRLDLYLADTFGISRNKAQFAISAQKVQVNGIVVEKSGYGVKETDVIFLLGNEEIKYVARSALKLKYLLEEDLDWDIEGKICLDIGASTGGFSQILLEKNAKQIYAVDVGTLQLHEKIRNDFRVISFEKTDIRDFAQERKGYNFDFIVCDVSFISLHHIIESILLLKGEKTKVALLFKPQYEVGKINLAKTGVPKNEQIIEEYLQKFCFSLKQKGIEIQKVILSELKGENGNKEYFIIF